MPVLDWIFAAILLISMLLGLWRGLVFEVLSVLSWVGAFILAQWWGPDLAQRLPMSGSGESVRYAVGFVLVFVLAVFVGGLLANVLKKIFAAAGLGGVDRLLGGLFGLVRGGVLVLASTVVICMTPLKSGEWWQASTAAGISTVALKGLQPFLPQEFAKYLPS